MIDFKKKLGGDSFDKKTNPIEIYDSLDRRSDTGPLRPAQLAILNDWYTDRIDNNDVIIKLHTGQGKTLIGLLILQSKLNSDKGPCLYVCPNIYLVQQTCEQAEKFGIKYCVIESDNSIPESFSNGERILITHVQKVFNGKTIFGLGNRAIKVESIILDDSHSCIDSIKQASTIRIPSSHELFEKFLNLFEEDLKEQGEGTFLELESGEYNSLLPVPYWAWNDKKSSVLALLNEYRDNSEILFSWPLIKDRIENCQCFIGGNEIEISAHFNPIHHFGSFSNASQRILMSATTQNDSFFIKGLLLDKSAVLNPLVYADEKWSGEKMILLPSLIDEELDRELIINKLAVPFKKAFGIAALVPSYRKAELYKNLGSKLAYPKTIYSVIQDLKSKETNETVVIVNRYDGIDLPDSSCRILIIDSKPFSEMLAEKYEEDCRPQSEIINIKVAQKIEQGLGRSVRGEKDYSVIMILGGSLVKFIRSNQTNKYFSDQTRQQIQIGFDIAEMAKEELSKSDSSFKVITGLLNQSLKRDEGWRGYYNQEMNKIKASSNESAISEQLELERDAEKYFFLGDYENAIGLIQKLIDNYCTTESERGWYMQLMAMYKYNLSKVESNATQKIAFTKNLQLLKPKEGISYKALDFINENRISRLKSWINQHSDYSEMMLAVDDIFGNLTFGEDSERFEKALQDIGILLGFLSQRPDKEFKKGPDNLWCGVNNEFILIECKNEIHEDRDELSKREVSQMNTHCAWFEENYGTDQKVLRIIISPTKNISRLASLGYPVQIMRKNRLRKFKSNVKSFIKEFKSYNIKEISDAKIQEWLVFHKLDINSIKTEYVESYYQKK